MITVHCLIKNEENFIWFALQSVLPFVEKVIVWDTGSIDNTVEIIRSIKSKKIEFEQIGSANPKEIANLRQKMIEQTKTDWIMILDGDEIWWKDSLAKIKKQIAKTECIAFVSPVYMLVGDIFHYQSQSAGQYKIADKYGHYNIRFIKNHPKLKVEGNYPDEAFVIDNTKLQDLPSQKLLFSYEFYLHASHLKRSNRSNRKFKYEIGEEFPLDFYYPESFFLPHPEIVSSPWVPLSGSSYVKSSILTPLRRIKRKLHV